MSANTDPSGSCFLNRLTALPIVQATKDLYDQSKESNVIIRKGLGVLEYGVGMATPAVESVVGNVPGSSALDMIACGYLEKIENKFPVLHEEPGEVIKDVKCNASQAIKSSVRKALRTYPGRTVIRGIDGMITWSENTLDQIQGTPDPTTQPPDIAGGDQALAPVEVTTEPGIIVKVGVMTPLEAYVSLLRFVKQLLASVAGLNTQGCPGSPDQPAIEGRRKASYRKRADGVIQRVTGTAMGIMGIGKDDEQKPEDDDDDTESLNLEDALLNYTSDNDPDYEVSGLKKPADVKPPASQDMPAMGKAESPRGSPAPNATT